MGFNHRQRQSRERLPLVRFLLLFQKESIAIDHILFRAHAYKRLFGKIYVTRDLGYSEARVLKMRGA